MTNNALGLVKQLNGYFSRLILSGKARTTELEGVRAVPFFVIESAVDIINMQIGQRKRN